MPGPTRQRRYDVVVVGAGHNGLVAAAYLAAAGLSVLVLERLPVTGGATSSAEPFPGLRVRTSPYAQLVGLLPDRVVRDLALEVPLRTRRTAAYVPLLRHGRPGGLLLEEQPSSATAESFAELTGSDREYDAWRAFHDRVDALARVVAPTMLEPLPRERELRARVDPVTWAQLVETPLGRVVEDRFTDDTVRGLVAADGLTGTFVDLHDPGLEQNRAFLYHHLAAASGGWRVPVGGMGSLASSLENAVRRGGGEILTNAFVTRVDADGTAARVAFQDEHEAHHEVDCTWVLPTVAPWLVQLLLGANPGARPEGSLLKVDMLLERLPHLRAKAPSPTAFAGTVHVSEAYTELRESVREAAEGLIPTTPSGSLHVPTLTDPSVLGPLAQQGRHLMTYLGRVSPARLFAGSVEAQRDELVVRMLDAVNAHLEEPIETLLALDGEGSPCLVAQAPQDVEAALAMPGGHPWHGPLSWPWAANRASLTSPAERWGVQTPVPNVLVCGAGTHRGGGVSGIGGHNAAMAVLEATGGPPR